MAVMVKTTRSPKRAPAPVGAFSFALTLSWPCGCTVGGGAGEPDAVMPLVVNLVGFDPAVGAGRFSPLGPLGTLNHLLFLATH
jgi:hypothetical protein